MKITLLRNILIISSLFLSLTSLSQEICSNGIDDNGDFSIDETDCIYLIKLSESIDKDTLYKSNQIDYTFNLNNNSGVALSNIRFTKNLPNGLFFKSEPFNVSELTIDNTAIKDKKMASFNITNLPTGLSSFSISVYADSTIETLQQFFTASFVSDIPISLGDTAFSDANVATSNFDSTSFIYSPEEEIILNIEKENSYYNFNIYPNPSHGSFNLELNDVSKNVIITIRNVEGKVVQKNTYNDQKFVNITLDEPKGIYHLTINSKQKKSTLKIIKK